MSLSTPNIQVDYPDAAPGVALIALNRPSALNALSKALLDDLVSILTVLDADDAIGAMVLTGNGKAFSAGVDLKEVSQDPSTLLNDTAMLNALKQRQTPMIAAVNGYAMTGGLELALWCDFIWAAESTVFADTHAKVGLLPTWGMTQWLPKRVGVSRAKELSLSARPLDANTACEWGLVNRVLPDADLLTAAVKLAGEIAANNSSAVTGIKQLIDFGAARTFAEGLANEYQTSHAHNDQLDFSVMLARLDALRAKS